MPKFDPGKVLVTYAALAALEQARHASGFPPSTEVVTMVARHTNGDWGDASSAQQQINARSLTYGGPIVSIYGITYSADDFYVTTSRVGIQTVVCTRAELNTGKHRRIVRRSTSFKGTADPEFQS